MSRHPGQLNAANFDTFALIPTVTIQCHHVTCISTAQLLAHGPPYSPRRWAVLAVGVRGLQALSEATGFPRQKIFPLRGEPRGSTENRAFETNSHGVSPENGAVKPNPRAPPRDPAGLKTPGWSPRRGTSPVDTCFTPAGPLADLLTRSAHRHSPGT
jgi:hypothetical protein